VVKWARTALVVGILAMAARVIWADGVIEYEVRHPEILLNLSVVELIVLFVEAAAYLAIIGLTFDRALLTALAANGASVAVAFLLGYALWTITQSGDRQWALFFGLAGTLAIELPIVAAMNRDFPNRRRLLGGALVLNLVTFAAATVYIRGLVALTWLLQW
jgi:hypothetical protein